MMKYHTLGKLETRDAGSGQGSGGGKSMIKGLCLMRDILSYPDMTDDINPMGTEKIGGEGRREGMRK